MTNNKFQKTVLVIFLLFGFWNLGVAPKASAGTLLQSTNLTHLGSFHVPLIPYPQDGFDYGGTAISYNPAHNSLFIVGHVYKQLIAEISIPEIGGMSTMLQPLTDATEGKLPEIQPGGNIQIGGTLPWGDKLIISAYVYYDGNGSAVLSHFIRPLDLSITGQVQGPFRVGSAGAGFYAGPMANVPSNWQGPLGGPVFTGLCCVGIISRTSLGPSLHTINPDNITPTGAKSLVYYPITHPTLGTDNATQYYSASDSAWGTVMPEGTDTVLFFGRHATSPYCYGPGTTDQNLVGTLDEYGNTWCYDPTSVAKGPHQYPYLNYAWAYDANELAKVARGEKQPWEVIPYATWELPGLSGLYPMGAAYDPARQRIYVSMAYGDQYAYPLIEVFQVSTGAAPAPTPIKGDINSDHIVNSIDYSILNSDWFTTNTRSDLNHDGLVNAIDYSLLNANWLRTW